MNKEQAKKRLEDLVATNRWDNPLLYEEAVNLGSKIFIPWMSILLKKHFRYVSLQNMFTDYSPFEELESAHMGQAKGPLHRVVGYQRDQFPDQSFTEWALTHIRQKFLRDKLETLPNSSEERYRQLLEKYLPAMLDFGYRSMEKDFTFYPLETLLTGFDPELKKHQFINRQGPLAFIYSWHSRSDNAKLVDSLSAAIDDGSLRQRLAEYPENYQEYVKHTFNHNIDLILKQFEKARELYLQEFRHFPQPSYLFRYVDLKKKYKNKPPVVDKYNKQQLSRAFETIYVRQLGISESTALEDTYQFFIDAIEDPEKRIQFAELVSVKTTEDLFARLISDYVTSCESAMEEDNFVNLQAFIGNVCHKWLRDNIQGEENVYDVAVRKTTDPVIKERLEALPSSKSDWIYQQREKALRLAVYDYISEAWDKINNEATLISVTHFLSKNYNPVYQYFQAKDGYMSVESIIQHLTEDQQSKIQELPNSSLALYTYLINKYAPDYVAAAPDVIKERPFTFRKFFIHFEPGKPFDTSVKRSFGKTVYWFQTTELLKDCDQDFDGWAISQIKDPIVRTWVEGVPKTAQERFATLLYPYIDQYEEHVANHFVYAFHTHQLDKSPKPKLTANKFIASTNFDQDLTSPDLYGKHHQGTFKGVSSYYGTTLCKMLDNPPEFTDWVVSILPEEKRAKFSRVNNYMTSKDPEIQRQALEVLYPKYQLLCDQHNIPQQERLMPGNFTQKVFPELYRHEK